MREGREETGLKEVGSEQAEVSGQMGEEYSKQREQTKEKI